ncbi:MAG: hypothetical protein PHX60_15735 [Giesbergeria sp.]|uniref:hypothetical protein n=1 Tax=Giesbergeria sp. TaxID=2818473 RepID=UPI002627BF41|nr:hypothetical protein [Giesbergeria sp.]MDD2611103.1 hypothetical protein [Giesbergeria sp.]
MEELKKRIKTTEEEIKEVKALPVGDPERALLMTLQARLTALAQKEVLLLNQAQGVVLLFVTRMRCVGLQLW